MVCECQSLTDLELVTKIQGYSLDSSKTESYRSTLFFRYEKLMFKMMARLRDKSRTADSEDYMSDAYECFLNAVASVDLPRIKRPDWSFWLVYWGYLSAHNRDVALREKKIHQNEIAMFEGFEEGGKNIPSEICSCASQYRSSEDECINKMTRDVFWTAVNNCMTNYFNDTQRKIFKMRGLEGLEGERGASVIRELGISPYMYRKELTSIRQIFSKELARLDEECHLGLPAYSES